MSNILTISSHVIHGYVGNKAIIFPLQYSGWEVDNINTVNFSNHTGYGSFKGENISASLLTKLLENIQPFSYLITGYVPNKELIEIVIEYITKYKKEAFNSQPFVYLMDPILGDEDQLYVDQSCVESYRSLVTHQIVDIVTPNQFELELLTDIKIKTVPDLVAAIGKMKDQAVRFVIVTSCRISSEDDNIYCVISSASSEVIKYFKIPLIHSYFTGVGDLFTSLLINKLYINYYSKPDKESLNDLDCLSKSVSQVLTIISKILRRTNEIGAKSGKEAKIGTLNIGYYELDLINSKELFSIDSCEYPEKILHNDSF